MFLKVTQPTFSPQIGRDPIFFDGNSGTSAISVNINVNTLYGKDLSFLPSAPAITFLGNTLILELFGSVLLQSSTSISNGYDVTWNLSGSGTHTITTNGNELSRIKFNGTGSYTLMDSLTLSHELEFYSGDFDANEKKVRVRTLYGNLASTADEVDFSNCEIILNDSWRAAEFVGESGYNFSGSTIHVVGDGARINCFANDTISLNEVFMIDNARNEISANYKFKIKTVHFDNIHPIWNIYQIDTLYIEGSSVLSCNGGNALRVKAIIQSGQCGDMLHLQGEHDDNQVDLIALNPLSLSNVTTLNLWVSGASVSASPGYSINNTSGISFSAPNPSTYYWIGGSGDWDDANNWSITSGGAAASCIPGLLDHVVFDNNSSSSDFTVITPFQVHVGDIISTTNQNLEIQGACWFGINGSATLNANSQLNLEPLGYDAHLVFTSNSATTDTIKIHSQIRSSVYFIGSGYWHISDSLAVSQGLSVIAGHVNMPDIQVRCDQFRDRYYPFGTGINDSVYMNITDAHIITRHLEFRKYDFKWDYDRSVVELQGEYPRCYFDETHPFWELRVSNPVANCEIHWDGFEAKLFNNYGKTKVHSYQYDHNWDTLRLHSNAELSFADHPQKVFIKHLDTRTDCYGYASILGAGADDTTSFHIQSDSINGQYLLIENLINATPAKFFSADQSIDLGNNQNITFTTTLGRTLYWVNNGGLWNDSIHWSLTSGGIGGECLPTPADSVVIDSNSLSLTGQIVDIGDESSYTGDLVITTETPFTLHWEDQGRLFCYKDVVLRDNVTIGSDWNSQFTFKGLDSSSLTTQNCSLFIKIQVEKATPGSLTLNDSILYSEGFYINRGGFYTRGNYMNMGRFYVTSNNDSTWVDADSTRFDIWGDWDAFMLRGNKTNWTSNQSKIYLSHDRSYARIEIPDTVEHIEFTHKNNYNYSSVFMHNNGHIEFLQPHANLNFWGASSIDTLILTPDQVYSFEANQIHTINDSLRARGDFCHYIGIKSTVYGTQASVVTNTVVAADFLEVRDLNYTGNQTFYTGAKSNDQGNNFGFIWSNKPGYVYGFPSDTSYLFCHDSLYTDSLLLTTYNFNDAKGFLWSTGDSTDILWVNQSGEYWVEADYISCKVYDTINVSLDYKAPLSYDAYICVGDPVSITANNGDTTYNYTWSDGSAGATIIPTIAQDTTLWVDIFMGNRYACSDTVRISAIEIASVAHSSINPLCYDDQNGSINLVSVAGGFGPYTYSWLHDNSLTSATASNLSDGCYGIIVEDTLGCSFSDTICLVAPPPLVPSFQLTLPFCEGDPGSIIVGANGGTPQYTYIYTFDPLNLANGNYSYTVTDANGCQADTVFDIAHTFEFDYSVLIDTATCGENNGGVQVIPANNLNAFTYSWSAYPGYSNNGQIFMGPSNGYIYIQDSVAGCLDTVYYEIPFAGATNATFLLSQDSGISPLTVQTTNLNSAPGIFNYWIINGDTISNATDTSFTFPGYGNYLITHCIYDPVYGCLFCFEKWVNVFPNPQIEIPNFFTPNNDGINDFFELSIGQDLEQLHIEIYNRWGNIVYESNAVDFKWDGFAMNGLKCADGVYFWILSYKEVNNPAILQNQGTVTLMD